MRFIDDESGQGAAEYILLFGGVIVIAIAALALYREYFNPGVSPFNTGEDIPNLRASIK